MKEIFRKAVEELIAMEDALKGEGGQAILDFYTSCHLPFLQYFLTFKEEFNTVLQQALASLEPVDAGHIVEEFLETDVEKGLTESADVTATLMDEANAIMDEVSDVIGLTKLDDTLVQESIADAKKKRDDTVEALNTFDSTQTTQLIPIETSIQSMKEWVQNIEELFKWGLTDVDFPSDKWTSMAVGSDITKELIVMGMSVGNILGKNEAASLIKQAVSKEIVVDEYNDIEEVSDIASNYYMLADGGKLFFIKMNWEYDNKANKKISSLFFHFREVCIRSYTRCMFLFCIICYFKFNQFPKNSFLMQAYFPYGNFASQMNRCIDSLPS